MELESSEELSEGEGFERAGAFADVLDKVGLSTASRPPLAATACRVAETAQYVEEGVASAAEVERIELAI